MRTRHAVFAALSLLAASSASATLTPPATSWRAYAVATDVSSDQSNLASQLKPLTTGGDAGFQPTISALTDPWFAFQAGPNVAANANWMVTFGSLYSRVVTADGSNAGNCQMATTNCSTDVSLEFQYSTAAGQNGNAPAGGWVTLGTVQSFEQLDQYTIAVNPNYWYKTIVHLNPNTTRPVKLYITDLALYDLSGSQPKDYWLMLGASIEVQSIDNADWKNYAKALFGADPVVFNMSRGGWLTTELLQWLDYFLAMHPKATYCAIHIGGNNVSFYRPYPGGSDILENDMLTIVNKVLAAGKIPVITRISYRHYRSPDVPPQANGSLPYILNQIDPIIQQYTPDFWDAARERGYMDGYSYIRQNPNAWLLDGVHLTAAGTEVWQQLWVQRPGTLIYGKQPNCANNQNIPCLYIPDCGNGAVEAGEECDDGNRDPNDGCNNDCINTNQESLNPNTPPVFCPDGTVYYAGGCNGTVGTTAGSGGGGGGTGTAGSTTSRGTTGSTGTTGATGGPTGLRPGTMPSTTNKGGAQFGCNAGAGGGWDVLVGLLSLATLRQRRRLTR